MKDSVYEQEIAEDEKQWPPIRELIHEVCLIPPAVLDLLGPPPVVELWDGEVVRRDTAITYLAELNEQQVDK